MDDTDHGDDDPGALVAAATFRDPVRAHLCRMALQEADIGAWLSTEHLAGIAPHLGIAIGVDVLVRGADLAAARQLMEDVESGSAALSDESEPCPSCGAAGAEHLSSPTRAGAVLGTFFVGVPRPDVVWTWRCVSCGHRWR